jgi:DnaJ-class molecular chaperone
VHGKRIYNLDNRKMSWTDGYKTYDPEKEGYGNKRQWKQTFYGRMSRDDAKAFLKEEDPYFILNITPGSSKAEIKKAYKTMARYWHPDINNSPNATEMMQKINAAYWAII